jgi:hypothetical protein
MGLKCVHFIKCCTNTQLPREALNEEGFWTAVEVGISNTSNPRDMVHTMTNDKGKNGFGDDRLMKHT